MTTPLRGRIDAEKRRLKGEISGGNRITISPNKAGGADLAGFIPWMAALELIADGQAIEIGRRNKRITRGPRPHNRFVPVLTIGGEAPDVF